MPQSQNKMQVKTHFHNEVTRCKGGRERQDEQKR